MKTQKLLLKTVSFAGFTAPRVQEAIIKWWWLKERYFYTHFTKWSKSSITASDRVKQKETTRELFNKNEELAYAVYEIDETVKLLNQLIAKIRFC
jgi:hypothetical protein